MKPHPRSWIVPGPFVLALAVCVSAPAAAQEPGRLNLPAFDELAKSASESVNITLDASLLRLAASVLGSDADEASLKQMLQDLKGIYVKSFEFDKEGSYPLESVEAVRAQLGKGNWMRMVDVKSLRDGTSAEIYLWMDKDVPGGLAIVSAEPRQLTIVNIVGRIDVEQLRKLEGQLGIPKLGIEADKRKH